MALLRPPVLLLALVVSGEELVGGGTHFSCPNTLHSAVKS